MAAEGAQLPVQNRFRTAARQRRRPPKPEVGDYFRTPGGQSLIFCFAYSTPHPTGPNRGEKVRKLRQDEVFGPVMRMHKNERFLSVEVPMWVERWDWGSRAWCWKKNLVWVNIFCYTNMVHFARMVPRQDVEEWKRRGWWMDGLEEV